MRKRRRLLCYDFKKRRVARLVPAELEITGHEFRLSCCLPFFGTPEEILLEAVNFARSTNLLTEEAVGPVVIESQLHLLYRVHALIVTLTFNKLAEVFDEDWAFTGEQLELHRVDLIVHSDVHLQALAILLRFCAFWS